MLFKLCCCLSLVLLCIRSCEGAEKLGTYNVNINESSVSGLSAGGYMAVQMHVAFSANFRGVAVFAGGPYHCAQGQVAKALTDCMSAATPPNLNSAISTTDSYASSKRIDPTSFLKDDRVYLFSGTLDNTVKPAVMNVLYKYYQHYVNNDNIEYVSTLRAAHTMPTDERINTNACTTSASPYISNCNYDGAGEALQVIYGDYLAPRNDGTLSGTFIEFDQTEFLNGKSFAKTGWLYVPKSCASGASCTLHVSFHGCLQTFADIGDKWVKNTGLNKWADTNDIIVLYPQAVKSTFSPSNPNGCFDWWGYNNAQNYDTKSGDQMKAVKAMMDRIGKGFVNIPSPTGLTVAGTTNTTVTLSWQPVQEAAGYNIYRDEVKANPQPVTAARYVDTGLQSGTSYHYNVRSVSAAGSESPPSPDVVATTTGTPPPIQPPTGLTVTSTTANSITLRWNSVPAAADYYVYRNGALAPNNPAGGTQFTDTGLTAETTYTYQVASLTEIGVESKLSEAIQGKTQGGWKCQTFTTSNYEHVQAGRAYNSLGYCYALGSNDYMGLYNLQVSTLAETAENFYVVGSC